MHARRLLIRGTVFRQGKSVTDPVEVIRVGTYGFGGARLLLLAGVFESVASVGVQLPRNFLPRKWPPFFRDARGSDDQAGTVNLITPANRRPAAAFADNGVCASGSLIAYLASGSGRT